MRYLLAVALIGLADGANAEPDDPILRGAAIYAQYCLRCHGPTAVESQVGDIRGLSVATVTGAVRGGPGLMPTIALTSDEIAAIIAYLRQL